ncbi:MAG: alpha/beta hydrolase [Spirochaetales bacterium]|nr:alpha/beta hydrolase [Spirochaetales bacterium]
MKDQYINCNGIKTRYWQSGKGSRTLVFIHGIGGSIEYWEPQLEAFSKDFTVYSPDMVGFGLTEKPDVPYGYRYFARFLKSFFTAVGIDRASLIGHSLGGGICLQFAVYYPENVERLILESSGGLSREFTFSLRVLTLPVIGELLLHMSLKNPLSLIKGLYYNTSVVRESLIDILTRMFREPGATRAFLTTLRNNATLFNGTKESISDIINHLDGITARTLVIWGKQDKVIPFHVSEIALRHIKQSRLWALDKCGHGPHLDYPLEFNKKVKEFLLE